MALSPASHRHATRVLVCGFLGAGAGAHGGRHPVDFRDPGAPRELGAVSEWRASFFRESAVGESDAP